MAERLSREQRRVLNTIAKQEEREEDGHDLEGDLSICSRNFAATIASLERRKLVNGEHDPWAMGEGTDQWTWNLTPKGCRALGIEP
jgi:DNA-binding MarR family transcriptional regulator